MIYKLAAHSDVGIVKKTNQDSYLSYIIQFYARNRNSSSARRMVSFPVRALSFPAGTATPLTFVPFVALLSTIANAPFRYTMVTCVRLILVNWKIKFQSIHPKTGT